MDIYQHGLDVLYARLSTIELIQFPRKFRKARLSDFSSDMREKIKGHITNREGLFLYGKPGRGKTHLAVATIHEAISRAVIENYHTLIKNRHESWGSELTVTEILKYVEISRNKADRILQKVFFSTTEALLRKMYLTFDEDNQSSISKIIEDYSTAEILILDDLGVEKMSEFVRDKFDSIVNARWAEELFTIYTSNLSIDELDSHYKDKGRMSSRIRGSCVGVELTGNDRRKVS